MHARIFNKMYFYIRVIHIFDKNYFKLSKSSIKKNGQKGSCTSSEMILHARHKHNNANGYAIFKLSFMHHQNNNQSIKPSAYACTPR